MKVSNQKPAVLSPVYHAKITGDFDPRAYMVDTLAKPLFNPVVANQPVTMTNGNGSPIDETIITDMVLSCCGETVNATAETACKTLYGQTLLYFDRNTNLPIQNLFSIQAASKDKLPFPTPTLVYTPATDVIPMSKAFLAGTCSYETYFATLAFYARPRTLGFYFANEACFNGFKTWLLTQTQALASVLPMETNKLLSDFQKLTLDGLTESLILRTDTTPNNDEYSFARLLISFMMEYTTQISSAEYGVLPFDLGELYCPNTVVFVNVEKHAHATSKQVADEWNMINGSINMKTNILSNKKLNRLTATAKNLQKIQGMAATASQNSNRQAERLKRIRFRKTPPTSVDLTRIIKKISEKMASVAKSENSYKSVKMSFAKPNRRNPDDFNKQGKVVSTKYRPDIHIYIDTSGSISERNYQDGVKACIKMAKAMNVNLYFNSFSHVMSQCNRLQTKDKSVRDIYATFQKIPKVSGGTDYEQIWHYINQSAKRRRELSIIMSDFEYSAPNHYVKHPKNLYYIPISHSDWDDITHYAKRFCESMMFIDPDCRKHILL